MADPDHFLQNPSPNYAVSIAIGPPLFSPKEQKLKAMACIVWVLVCVCVWGGLLDSFDQQDAGFSEEHLSFSQLGYCHLSSRTENYRKSCKQMK